jgi:hypothetical protein
MARAGVEGCMHDFCDKFGSLSIVQVIWTLFCGMYKFISARCRFCKCNDLQSITVIDGTKESRNMDDEHTTESNSAVVALAMYYAK